MKLCLQDAVISYDEMDIKKVIPCAFVAVEVFGLIERRSPVQRSIFSDNITATLESISMAEQYK